MDKKATILWRIIIGIALFFIAGLVITGEPFRTLTYITAILIAGLDIAIMPIKRLRNGFSCLRELIPVVSCIGMLLMRHPSGAFAVMLFFRICGYAADICTEKAEKPMDLLKNLTSATAAAERNGEYNSVSVSEVRDGEIIVVKAGERIPLDGTVVTGEGFMDIRAFTGEASPRNIRPGSRVISGAINFGSTIYVKADRPADSCAAERIKELAYAIYGSNSDAQRQSVRFSRSFTSAAIALAVLIMFIPPMITDIPLMTQLYRGFTITAVSGLFFTISSVRIGFMSSFGKCALDGIFFKDFRAIEQLASGAAENPVINAEDPAEVILTYDTAIITNEPRTERALSAAKRTVRTVRLCVIIPVIVKLAVIALAILGHIGIWGAVCADSLTSIVILNLAANTGKKTVRKI